MKSDAFKTESLTIFTSQWISERVSSPATADLGHHVLAQAAVTLGGGEGDMAAARSSAAAAGNNAKKKQTDLPAKGAEKEAKGFAAASATVCYCTPPAPPFHSFFSPSPPFATPRCCS